MTTKLKLAQACTLVVGVFTSSAVTLAQKSPEINNVGDYNQAVAFCNAARAMPDPGTNLGALVRTFRDQLDSMRQLADSEGGAWSVSEKRKFMSEEISNTAQYLHPRVEHYLTRQQEAIDALPFSQTPVQYSWRSGRKAGYYDQDFSGRGKLEWFSNTSDKNPTPTDVVALTRLADGLDAMNSSPRYINLADECQRIETAWATTQQKKREDAEREAIAKAEEEAKKVPSEQPTEAGASVNTTQPSPTASSARSTSSGQSNAQQYANLANNAAQAASQRNSSGTAVAVAGGSAAVAGGGAAVAAGSGSGSSSSSSSGGRSNSGLGRAALFGLWTYFIPGVTFLPALINRASRNTNVVVKESELAKVHGSRFERALFGIKGTRSLLGPKSSVGCSFSLGRASVYATEEDLENNGEYVAVGRQQIPHLLNRCTLRLGFFSADVFEGRAREMMYDDYKFAFAGASTGLHFYQGVISPYIKHQWSFTVYKSMKEPYPRNQVGSSRAIVIGNQFDLTGIFFGRPCGLYCKNPTAYKRRTHGHLDLRVEIPRRGVWGPRVMMGYGYSFSFY